MEWITGGVIAGLAGVIITFLKLKFKGAFKYLPKILKYSAFGIEALQAAGVLIKAVLDPKVTTEQVSKFRKELQEAIDAGVIAFERKKGDYSDTSQR